MTNRTFSVVAGAIFACGAACAADFIITGVSNEGGVKTRLALANRSGTPAVARLSLAGAGLDTVEKTVPALGTLVVADVLSELWGVSERRGVVLVTTDQPAVVTAGRFVDVGESGRAGSALHVVPREDTLGPGAVADFLWVSREAALDWYAAEPGSEVQVSLVDGTGQRLGSKTYRSDEAVHRLEVASLSDTEWTAARLEVKVKSGRAAASLDFPNVATGRWATVAPMTEGMNGQQFVLAPAFHSADLAGVTFRSDLRLFNPGRTAARITARLGEQETTIEIPPRAITEVEDVLAAWFEVQDPLQGILRFQSSASVFAAARTVAGDSFEFRAVPQAFPLLNAGSALVLGGVRGPAAWKVLGLLADTADVGAGLSLTDRDGQVVAQATLSLAAGEWRQSAFDDLFPGITIPDDSTLEVRALDGALDLTLLTVDTAAGDLEWLDPQIDVVDPACALPVISSVTTSSRNLAAAGDVRLEWATRQADSVTLEPLQEALPASGERTLSVTRNSTFRLVARNACGDTSATLAVSVGKPALRPVTVLGATTSGSGEPGQLFALTLDNVGDLSQVTALVLRESTRIEMQIPIEGFSEDGVPYARIPLVADASVAAGYRTGAFTVAAVVEGVETAAVPLTIRPMAAVDDPVGAMRAVLDGLAAARLPAETDAEIDALAAAVSVEGTLRQLLNDIQASGQGTLRYATTAAGAVTVRRADLAAIVALNRNYVAQSGGVVFSKPTQRAASTERFLGTCLDNTMPHMAKCRDKERLEKELWLLTDPHPVVFDNEDLDRAFQQGRDAAVRYISRKLAESAAKGLIGRLNLMLNWTNLVCALQPIRLNGFKVKPNQFNITKPLQTRGTELWALFVPKTKQQDIAAELEAEETKKIMDQIPQRYRSLKPLIEPGVKAAVHAVYGDLDAQIAGLIKKIVPSLSEDDTRQVGKCDINRFYAFLNGPQEEKYDRKTAILIPIQARDERWGRDTYYFAGFRRGPETMCIRPYDSHFLLSPKLLGEFRANPDLRGKMCEFKGVDGVSASKLPGLRFDLIPQRVTVHYSDVSVGGAPSLTVSTSTVNAWCLCDDQERSGIILPGVRSQSNGLVEFGPPFSNRFNWRKSAADVSVTKMGYTKWRVVLKTNAVREVINQRVQFHDALAQVRVNFTNPPNRDNTHTIGLTVVGDPGCERPASFTGFVSGITGGSANILQTPSNPFQPFKRYYTGFEQGQIQFNLGGELSGFQTITSNCRVEATIDLLDGPPPQ